MLCVTGRVPGFGRGAAWLIRPSAVAVSGPVLPAPYLREEDPPSPWPAAARDALTARGRGGGTVTGQD
jgi:hypothetical protein